MSDFNRRLPDNALTALQALMSRQIGWWPDLLAHWAPSGSDGCLRLAIRNGYMNFYSSGQSIAKVTFGHGGHVPALSVHEKYVNGPAASGQRYIKFSTQDGRDTQGPSSAWGGSKMLQAWIKNSAKHCSNEKRCIEALVAASPKVIDLEMGLPAVDDRTSALRMDIVSLENAPNGIRLVFWEGKMIGDARLRSRVHEPKVFQQIRAYRSYLRDDSRKQKIARAYQQCCRIIRDLHVLASRVANIGPIDPLILAAADCNNHLDIEDTPRLLIFDDGANRREDIWQTHLDVLRRCVPVAIAEAVERMANPLELIPRAGG